VAKSLVANASFPQPKHTMGWAGWAGLLRPTSQYFSFDTPNAPSKRTSRFTRSGNYGVTAKSRHSPGTPFNW
jgi:hypothetical protein